jgi:hypothetical protein
MQTDSKNENFKEKEFSKKLVFNSLTNPVLVYVKILMTLFLILIHLKSKLFNQQQEFRSVTDGNNRNDSPIDYFNLNAILMKELMQSDKIKMYTQYCLVMTLVVFVLTKLFKRNVKSKILSSNGCVTIKKQKIQEENNEKQSQHETKQEQNNSIAQMSSQHIAVDKQTLKNEISIQTDLDDATAYQVAQENDETSSKRKRTISYNKSIQTPINVLLDDTLVKQPRRTVNQCLDFLREKKNVDDFLEEEIIELVKLKLIPIYKLETYFTDPIKGIYLR